MDAFQPMRFGRRLWVVPSWHDTPEPDAVNLSWTQDWPLVPARPHHRFMFRAPGCNAEHARTRVRFWLRQRRIGTGCPGIGAKYADGTDIDPQALIAMQDNAWRNGVSDQIKLTFQTHLNRPGPMN